jgi:hypothetical protein
MNNKEKNPQQIHPHFVEQLQMRFKGVKLESIEETLKYCKKFTPADLQRRHIPYSALVAKLKNPNYSNSVYYVSEKLNAMFVSVGDKLLMNALYLDGSYGY